MVKSLRQIRVEVAAKLVRALAKPLTIDSWLVGIITKCLLPATRNDFLSAWSRSLPCTRS